MIIDADCHISSRKVDGLDILDTELIDIMDRAEVARSLIWLKPPYNHDIRPENLAVYNATRNHPDRFLGLGWVNPRLGEQESIDTIKQCFEEYGLLGIKFNGAQDDYVIDSDMVLPFIDTAARFGKPIAFHIGADFFENTHPYRLGRLAERYPETTFLMIHMGGAHIPALDRSAIETAAKYKNIHVIGSNISAKAVGTALKVLGPDRISFGSDTPFQLMHVEVAKYKAIMRDMNEKDVEKVMSANILRILGCQAKV